MSAATSIAVAATVGIIVAPDSSLATIPYGTQFLFILLFTYPINMIMTRYGRRLGFYLGIGALIIAGILGYTAISQRGFALLVASHAFLGIFLSTASYYRYAVTDNLPDTLKPGALSLVVAGGIVGPLFAIPLANMVKDIEGFETYSLCYLAFVGFAVINGILLAFIPFAKPTPLAKNSPIQSTSLSKTEFHFIVLGITSAAVGFCLMTLTMVQASLHMMHQHIGFAPMSYAIQWHAMAMFAPSFFTGKIIRKFGHRAVILTGAILYIVTFVLNIFWKEYWVIALALILLGVAWNFTYVAGSALLTISGGDANTTKKWQGIGETAVAIVTTAGAFAPSILFSLIGWEYTNILTLAISIGLTAYIAYSLKNNKPSRESNII